MGNRTQKLTKSLVKNEPPATDGKQFIVWDTEVPGFGLRVSKASKSYLFKGRVNGRQKKVTIGRAEQITVADARDQARALAVEMRSGIDPMAKRARESVLDITLRESLDDYLATNTRLKERTRKEYRSILESKLPDWLDKPVANITPQMVKKRYQDITAKAKTQGDLAFRVARIIINNAIGLMEDAGADPIPNPCRVLSRQKMWRGVVRKQTVIPPDKLPEWWAAANELADGDRAVADLFRFLLLTGLRKSEALGLLWSDVDLERRTVIFTDTKNRRDHTLPLADHALTILTRRKEMAGRRPYVFESDRGRVSNLRYFQQDVKKKTGLWITPHDLRRTFLSIGADFLPELVLKRLVNHVNSANVTEGYVIKAVDDLRDPMQRLEDRILRLAEPNSATDKVVPIEDARRSG